MDTGTCEATNGGEPQDDRSLQDAVATATDPFLLNRLIVVDPLTGRV